MATTTQNGTTTNPNTNPNTNNPTQQAQQLKLIEQLCTTLYTTSNANERLRADSELSHIFRQIRLGQTKHRLQRKLLNCKVASQPYLQHLIFV